MTVCATLRFNLPLHNLDPFLWSEKVRKPNRAINYRHKRFRLCRWYFFECR